MTGFASHETTTMAGFADSERTDNQLCRNGLIGDTGFSASR